MKQLFLTLLLVLLSLSAEAKITGKWREVLPPCDTLPDICHYMCPIGERQVLMIGAFSNKPGAPEETWLYTHDIPEWRRVNCETPDSDVIRTFPGRFLCKVSKTRAIFYGKWIFDLDSMQWYEMDRSMYPPPQLNIGEDSVVIYQDVYDGRHSGKTWLVKFDHTKQPQEKDLWYETLLNNELITGFGPGIVDPYTNEAMEANICYFNKDLPINYINQLNYDTGIARIFMYMDMKNYSWLYHTEGEVESNVEKSIVFMGRGFCLLCNNVLFYGAIHVHIDSGRTESYVVSYDSVSNYINIYKLELDMNPTGNIWKSSGLSAQLCNGKIVAYYGGTDTAISRSTWVFEMDCVSMPNTFDSDSVRLLNLGDNQYQLADGMLEAKLYDLLGNYLCDIGERIDLNKYAIGTYFLQYKEDKQIKAIKLLRK
jgi:hypothetical protein